MCLVTPFALWLSQVAAVRSDVPWLMVQVPGGVVTLLWLVHDLVSLNRCAWRRGCREAAWRCLCVGRCPEQWFPRDGVVWRAHDRQFCNGECVWEEASLVKLCPLPSAARCLQEVARRREEGRNRRYEVGDPLRLTSSLTVLAWCEVDR